MTPQDDKLEPAKTVAAIDIGSNSVRLVVAQVFPDGRIDVLERAHRLVRLGHDTFVTGRLSRGTVNAVIKVLRDYRKILDTYQVDQVRAVATSSVREAANRDSFLDRIARTVDLDLEVIEPMEQSRLIVSAVRHAVEGALDLHDQITLIAEVGGGSTLLSIVRDDRIADSRSYNLGSVRIQEVLSTAQEPPKRAAELLRQHIAHTVALISKAMSLKEATTFLAIGGDARFAARQVGESIPSTNLSSVGVRELDKLMKRCVSKSTEELSKEYGMAFADAETLVPALLVYRALLRATGTDTMIVSRVSMRDGLLSDLPRFVTGQEAPELSESITLSAKTVAQKYECDEKHGEHVAKLATRLFDELQNEHGLRPQERLLLCITAMLHEVGEFISNRAHHKHSYYLISNSEIFGLSPEDISIVALVARYHRRSVPRSTHPEYMALSRNQRMRINKLAAILRVADALDKGHRQEVREFQVEKDDQEFVLYVEGVTDLRLERRALEEKGNLFEDIYGMKVRLEEAALSPKSLEIQVLAEEAKT